MSARCLRLLMLLALALDLAFPRATAAATAAAGSCGSTRDGTRARARGGEALSVCRTRAWKTDDDSSNLISATLDSSTGVMDVSVADGSGVALQLKVLSSFDTSVGVVGFWII